MKQTTKSILMTLTLAGSVIAAVLPVCSENASDAPASRPSVLVKSYAEVRGAQVKLADIAEIYPNSERNAKLAESLKGVIVADAPAPKTTVALTGTAVLDAIDNAGISRDTIGYSIPNIVTIERSGRVLLPSELLAEVRKEVAVDSAHDLQVREVQWENSQIVPLGETTFSVKHLGEPSVGKMPLQIGVFVDSQPAARFLATALVDYWKEVPVLNKSLERGMLIAPEDVELVRLNLQKQPNDLVEKADHVVGHRAKSNLRAGDTVRRSQIDVPPLVAKGSRVTMIYSNGALEATATGIAVEDGFEAGDVQVRNENSKKIVQAHVVNADTVEVRK